MRSIKEALKEVQLKDLWLEFGFLAFMALYLANMYRGAQINKRMAYSWAKEFAAEGSILDRNFSHVGICAQLPLLCFPISSPGRYGLLCCVWHQLCHMHSFATCIGLSDVVFKRYALGAITARFTCQGLDFVHAVS